MPVENKLTNNNSAVVISIKGKFNFDLRNEFRDAYNVDDYKSKKIIIDLRDTPTIDSSALGMLLNMQRSLDKKDGDIDIINCNPDIFKIFQVTHFEKKFKIN